MAWSQYIGRTRRELSGLDRLVSNCNLDYGSCLVTGGKTALEILNHTKTHGFASNVAYQEVLAIELKMNRANVFSYGKRELDSSPPFTIKKKNPRHISQDPVKSLDAPGLVDDFSLNLLDWGSNNVLAVALQDIVYLWNALNKSTQEVELEGLFGDIVTSVRWAPNARHIAFGLSNSHVQVLDCETLKLVTTLRGCHNGRVGALAWNSDHLITTGGRDHCIVNNDLRVHSSAKETYRGHRQEVCGLQWSSSGEMLASGGLDSRVFIWDTRQSQWLQKLQSHKGAVKALAWCPYQRNLLATGGGEDDCCIKFWNARSGSCLNSIDTGSQVTALLWNHHERELLSSHGLSKNQLILWDYPSMVRRAEIFGHTSRILNMSQSPDGTVVSAAAGDDESLKFWNVFGDYPKPVEKKDDRPFAHLIYNVR